MVSARFHTLVTLAVIFANYSVNASAIKSTNRHGISGHVQEKSEYDEMDLMKTELTQLSQSIKEFQERLDPKLQRINQVLADKNEARTRIKQTNASCVDDSINLKNFVSLPSFRNPEDFDVAVCNLKPNTKIGSNVTGQVIIIQKKTSPFMFINIMAKGFKTGSNEQALSHPNQTTSTQEIHSERLLHGFHVHQINNFSDGCDSTGGHYNPFNVKHGAPNSETRHVGDFGNIESDGEGNIRVLIDDKIASLRAGDGAYNIIGKPMVIHEKIDDLGRNVDDPGSVASGNAGRRLACCLIEKLSRLQDSRKKH